MLTKEIELRGFAQLKYWNIQTGLLEDWNNGILFIKSKKHHFWFRSASLEDRFAEARGKGFLAFSLKCAASGRSSNLYQGNTYP
jgi:hypothetical protein